MFDDDDKLIDFNVDKYADAGSLFDDDWLVADFEPTDFDEEDWEEYSDEEMDEYDTGYPTP